MYAIVTQSDKGYLPTVISMNDPKYCDMMMAGYEQIETGTRKEMLDRQKELIEDFVYEMNFD